VISKGSIVSNLRIIPKNILNNGAEREYGKNLTGHIPSGL